MAAGELSGMRENEKVEDIRAYREKPGRPDQGMILPGFSAGQGKRMPVPAGLPEGSGRGRGWDQPLMEAHRAFHFFRTAALFSVHQAASRSAHVVSSFLARCGV